MPFTIPVDSLASDAPKKTGFTVPVDKDAGISSRIDEDWQKRRQMGDEAIGAYTEGKQSLPATAYDILGKVGFGGLGDVAKEAGKSAISATPDVIKKPVGKAASYLGSEIMKTSEGQAGLIALKAGEASWSNFKENHPEAARHIEATFDIAGALTGARAFEAIDAAAAGGSLESAGKKLYEAGEKQAAKRKEDFLNDLVSPKETKNVKESQVGRTTEKGLLKQKVVEPTPQEKEIAQEVGKIPGVSPKKSLQGNYNVIAKANKDEAERLQGLLKAQDIPVDFKDVQEMIDKSVQDISGRTYIGADGEIAARKVAAMMNNVILQNVSKDGQITASGLLQARKDFDAMALKERPNIFNPNPDAAFTASRETVYQMRQNLNNLIEEKMPNAQYKSSLKRQSNFYRAMDNIEAKAANEGKNVLTRALQKAADKIPAKTMIGKTAVAAGVPYGAVTHPVAAALGGLGYGGYKAATSPITKKALGYGMQKAGQGIGMLGKPVIDTGTPLESVARQVQPKEGL